MGLSGLQAIGRPRRRGVCLFVGRDKGLLIEQAQELLGGNHQDAEQWARPIWFFASSIQVLDVAR
jgi:hypothetical protein